MDEKVKVAERESTIEKLREVDDDLRLPSVPEQVSYPIETLVPEARTQRSFMQWERSLNHRARQWEQGEARQERSLDYEAMPMRWFYFPQESEDRRKRSSLMDRFWKWERGLKRKPAGKPSGKHMWFNIAV